MHFKNMRWLGLLTGIFVLCLTAAGPVRADDDIAQTEDVVVTATKTAHSLADVPIKTEVIARQEIENKKYKSLQEVLERMPGLRVDMTSGSWGDKGKVRIRGDAQKALSAYKKAVSRYDRDPALWQNLGKVCYDLGRFSWAGAIGSIQNLSDFLCQVLQ